MVLFPQLSDCSETDNIHLRLKCKICKFEMLINKIPISHVTLRSDHVCFTETCFMWHNEADITFLWNVLPRHHISRVVLLTPNPTDNLLISFTIIRFCCWIRKVKLCNTSINIKVNKNPLHEWSAHHRDIWQHTTFKGERQPCPWRDSSPNPSNQAAADIRLRPRCRRNWQLSLLPPEICRFVALRLKWKILLLALKLWNRQHS